MAHLGTILFLSESRPRRREDTAPHTARPGGQCLLGFTGGGLPAWAPQQVPRAALTKATPVLWFSGNSPHGRWASLPGGRSSTAHLRARPEKKEEETTVPSGSPAVTRACRWATSQSPPPPDGPGWAPDPRLLALRALRCRCGRCARRHSRVTGCLELLGHHHREPRGGPAQAEALLSQPHVSPQLSAHSPGCL